MGDKFAKQEDAEWAGFRGVVRMVLVAVVVKQAMCLQTFPSNIGALHFALLQRQSGGISFSEKECIQFMEICSLNSVHIERVIDYPVAEPCAHASNHLGKSRYSCFGPQAGCQESCPIGYW